jgi:uncharacterized protein (UPF0335 family)
VSDPAGEVRSVLGLITTADRKNTDRLFYRTLVGPKNLPEAVEKIEQITTVKETLPESMQDVADEAKESLMKALSSTVSVKGHFLSMLTTNKSEIKINDPKVRRQIAGGLLRNVGGDDGYY